MSIPSWLNAPTTAAIGGDWFQVVESPADAYIKRLENEPNPSARLHFAARALRHDPGCIEAHLLLAENATEMHVRFAHLRKAVETGDALWCPVAARDDDFAWWGVSATRPYMQAMAALATEYAAWGDDTSANALRNRLLGMNPYDNQGIRHLMADGQLDHAGDDDMDDYAAPRM